MKNETVRNGIKARKHFAISTKIFEADLLVEK